MKHLLLVITAMALFATASASVAVAADDQKAQQSFVVHVPPKVAVTEQPRPNGHSLRIAASLDVLIDVAATGEKTAAKGRQTVVKKEQPTTLFFRSQNTQNGGYIVLTIVPLQ